MMKSQRRAGWLVGLLVGVSMVAAPLEAVAYVIKWPEPGPPQMGDPDEPYSPRPAISWRMLWQLELSLLRAPQPCGDARISIAKAAPGNQRRTGVSPEGIRK